MGSTVKLANDLYLETSSIVHNGELLSDILNIQEIPINFNMDYIYSSDLDYICVKIGKLVILNIHTIAFKQEVPTNGQMLINQLPIHNKGNAGIIFYLYGGGINASGKTLRLALTQYGNIQTHWSSDIIYGDSANTQYSGILIYKAK